MSLIDPKHLVAPFKNTVHIVTIVFLVILFAVFRLATGSIEISSGGFSNMKPGLIPESAPKPSLPVMPSKEPNADSQGLQDIEKALGINK